MKTILLITDFYYQAKGREYFREDLELSRFLKNYFHVPICHIEDAEKILPQADAVLLRNTGPQASHQKALAALRQRTDLLLSNDLKGKGDINGKQHLLDLFAGGYPVIPTFLTVEDLNRWGSADRYLMKPMNGADSVGVQIVEKIENKPAHLLIQPLIRFQYEVSFYFIDDQFFYALYAPEKRWELVPYSPTPEDLRFAKAFVDWNTCRRGIQRIDACRTLEGNLLLMEIEDYNPYLSLDLLPEKTRCDFLNGLRDSLSLSN